MYDNTFRKLEVSNIIETKGTSQCECIYELFFWEYSFGPTKKWNIHGSNLEPFIPIVSSPIIFIPFRFSPFMFPCHISPIVPHCPCCFPIVVPIAPSPMAPILAFSGNCPKQIGTSLIIRLLYGSTIIFDPPSVQSTTCCEPCLITRSILNSKPTLVRTMVGQSKAPPHWFFLVPHSMFG